MCIDDETFERLWTDFEEDQMKQDLRWSWRDVTLAVPLNVFVWLVAVPVTFTATVYLTWTVCEALVKGVTGIAK